jgi:hypothetical protein
MKTLHWILLPGLITLAACKNEDPYPVPVVEPLEKEVALHVVAAKSYEEPVFDSVKVEVTLTLARHRGNSADVLWDTTLAETSLRRYVQIPVEDAFKVKLTNLNPATDRISLSQAVRYKDRGMLQNQFSSEWLATDTESVLVRIDL